ncbi:MAG: hypothetical protein GC155_09375 [Alphaproteobacteria bacterium]|nr:hypothetical protein [Alphaproteobacteria bacterium]
MRTRTILLWLALGLGAVVAILLRPLFGPSGSPCRQYDSARLVYLLVYALAISGTLWVSLRNQGWKALRYVVIWLAIGGLIALLYLVTHH